jgi:hypothetical protein
MRKSRTVAFRILRIALIGLANVIFLMTTTPDRVPAVLLLVPFVGLLVFLYLILIEIIRLLGPDEEENGAIVRIRRPRILAGITAGFPVLLLLLQSVVELTWWDVLIASLIVLVSYIYIARGSRLLLKR